MQHSFLMHTLTCVTLGVALTGCASFGTGKPAPLKTIAIPCQVPMTVYETTTRAALVKAGFTLVQDPDNTEEVEASRSAVYTSTGEGLQMNGPYRWDSKYAGGVVTVTVQTVHVNPDGSVYPSASHDENAQPSDRRHFISVIRALREVCKAPAP